MAYSVECFRTVKNLLQQRRSQALAQAEENRALFRSHSPRAAAIDAALEESGLSLFRIACAGGDKLQEHMDALRRDHNALMEEKRAILRDMGKPENFTEAQYTCPACRDTGYTRDGLMCTCMRRALAEEEIRQSGIGVLVDRQGFDNFIVPPDRPRMQINFDICRRYAEEFCPGRSGNLLLMGATGLGKTHLSTAIAGRVIGRGFRVVYESMPNVLNDFQYDRFHSSAAPITRRYFDAELLILDDIGAEVPNPYATAVLYQLINTRLNKGAACLFSTNLMADELIKRYDARIGSRLYGESRVLLFEGEDYRITHPSGMGS